MFVRKTLAGAVAAALAGSAIALSAGAASAATDPDDPSFTPIAADLIGVGSDTSQHAMHLFAEAWTADAASGDPRIASFAATGGGNITLPSGDIPRPNGSGDGKAKLFGPGENPDVDFARSSSANSTDETNAGLQAFPFALDTLVMAVSGNVTSHAPTALTPAQIVSIYKGDTTNWSEVGGTSGTIVPEIPQNGSGTRKFFEAQLKAMNGGVAVTLGGDVVEVQEHDPSTIQNNADAIAPFSEGRAGLVGTALRVETGWSADRALYNVVRGADVSLPLIQAAFGSDGALCSTDSRDLIEQAGFEQLATPEHGGVCGAPTQSATSNFTTNEQVVTTTTLDATSPRGGVANLAATVEASTAPSGTVDFFEGETQVASDVPLVGGTATVKLTGVEPGTHTYTAMFTPDEGSVFDPSEAEADVFVLFGSKLTESFPAKVAKGKRATGVVTVITDGNPTGKVMIKEGKKTLRTATLKGGKAKITLPKLSKGKHRLKAVYGGNAKVAGSSKSFTITQK
jgi:ABC-type phosphate transport system substrate-binding protein